jgi:hypothetical protein
MKDHRAALRRRMLKAGTISFGGGAIDCNRAQPVGRARRAGCHIAGRDPGRFTLVVDKDQSKLPCRIVWRKEKRIGARFEAS